MRLYVVRHGQTEENAAGIVQGHQPGTLSPLGIEQAKLLARRLQDINFDAIYSSDSQRAFDTARYVAHFQRAPVSQTPLLRERNAGVYQGRPYAEMGLAEQQSGLSRARFIPENGESFPQLKARVSLFLDSLPDQSQDDTLLIVSHGGWNKMLLSLAMNLEIEESFTYKQMNTCVNLLDYDRGAGFTVHLLNCTEHLAPLAAIAS